MSIFEITSGFTYCQNVIVGLGTAGNACVEQMHQANISDAHFACLSQDESSINESSTYTWIEFDYLDSGLEQETSGVTLKARHLLEKIMSPADCLFLVIDTGDCTVMATVHAIVQLAIGMGIYFIFVVMTSVNDEYGASVVDEYTGHLLPHITALINIPGPEILTASDHKWQTRDSLKSVSRALENTVRAMQDFNSSSTLINQSMKDVREAMSGMGKASAVSASAVGKNRAKIAALSILRQVAMINASTQIATNIFVNITTSESNMSLYEHEKAGKIIYDHIPDNIKSFVGFILDPDLGDEMRITLIANGRLL